MHCKTIHVVHNRCTAQHTRCISRQHHNTNRLPCVGLSPSTTSQGHPPPSNGALLALSTYPPPRNCNCLLWNDRYLMSGWGRIPHWAPPLPLQRLMYPSVHLLWRCVCVCIMLCIELHVYCAVHVYVLRCVYCARHVCIPISHPKPRWCTATSPLQECKQHRHPMMHLPWHLPRQ